MMYIIKCLDLINGYRCDVKLVNLIYKYNTLLNKDESIHTESSSGASDGGGGAGEPGR
jgi:hypothetical protein